MNFYDSIIEGAQELTVQERGQLYVACLEYLFFEGRTPDFDMKPSVRALFISHKVSFDRQLARKQSGRKGGQRKAENERRAKQNASKRLADPKQSRSKAPSKTMANQKQSRSKPPSKTLANEENTLWQTPTEQEQERDKEKPLTCVSGKEKPKQPRPFVPPTVEDVARVARERGLTLVEPEEFWAHYDAQGWVLGNGNPMVSWESKLISWNSERRLRQQAQGEGGAYDAAYD